jgi:hypothetical protein
MGAFFTATRGKMPRYLIARGSMSKWSISSRWPSRPQSAMAMFREPVTALLACSSGARLRSGSLAQKFLVVIVRAVPLEGRCTRLPRGRTGRHRAHRILSMKTLNAVAA